MNTMGLFTRLAQSHQPDCILSLKGAAPEAVANPDVLARDLGSDAVGAYAAECHPIYEDLRRIIGQLAGLLVLVRLTVRAEVADLVEIKRCQTRWNEARLRLQALVAPTGLIRHKVQLDAAHAFSGDVVHAFFTLRGQGLQDQLDQMSLRIQRAYVHLEAASSQKARLHMVDFSHACCCAIGDETQDV